MLFKITCYFGSGGTAEKYVRLNISSDEYNKNYLQIRTKLENKFIKYFSEDDIDIDSVDISTISIEDISLD